MRIVYFGSAGFGLPSLEAIRDSAYELVGVFTQPAHRAGRGRKVRKTAVAVWCEENGIDCVEADNINSPEMFEKVSGCHGDLLVVIAFGQKICDKVIGWHEKGAINVHGSLLPKYRGAAPINAAIVNGDDETGISIITVCDRMDAGFVLGTGRCEITADDNAETVHDKLSALSPGVLLDVIGQIESGTAVYDEQDEEKVTHAYKMKKSNGYVDWSQPAGKICDKIRGFWSWPGAQSDYVSQKTGKCIRVTFAKARVVEGGDESGRFGLLDDELRVICGGGRVELLEVKPAGGKLMGFKDFVNGRGVLPGDCFIPIEEKDRQKAEGRRQ